MLRDLHKTKEELVNRRYSIMGLERHELETGVINYCYEVDDEVDEGNANDQVMEH